MNPKYDINSPKDCQKLHSLVLMLLQSRKGETHSGYTARRLFSDIYGIDFDHHVYIDVLDEMSRRGEAKFLDNAGGDGASRWFINLTPDIK